MFTSKKASVARRDFLKGAAAGAAVFVASPAISEAQQTAGSKGSQQSAAAEGNIAEIKARIALATRMLGREGNVGASRDVSIRHPRTHKVVVRPADVRRHRHTSH